MYLQILLPKITFAKSFRDFWKHRKLGKRSGQPACDLWKQSVPITERR